MSDEMIIHCCAPTMAALKTGSVFNCPFESEEEMRNSLSDINVCLKRKGVSVVALRYRKGRGLVYFYRPKMLEKDLKGHLAKELLADYGWGDGEWMRSWEARCKEAGIALPFGCVMAHETPDAAAMAACKALGEALA